MAEGRTDGQTDGRNSLTVNGKKISFEDFKTRFLTLFPRIEMKVSSRKVTAGSEDDEETPAEDDDEEDEDEEQNGDDDKNDDEDKGKKSKSNETKDGDDKGRIFSYYLFMYF